MRDAIEQRLHPVILLEWSQFGLDWTGALTFMGNRWSYLGLAFVEHQELWSGSGVHIHFTPIQLTPIQQDHRFQRI
jgi:hypothetical protein